MKVPSSEKADAWLGISNPKAVIAKKARPEQYIKIDFFIILLLN